MRARTTPDLRAVVAELLRQGWRYSHTGRHARLYPPDRDKSPVSVPGSPSDYRGLRNFVAEVRRAGGVWPPRKRT